MDSDLKLLKAHKRVKKVVKKRGSNTYVITYSLPDVYVNEQIRYERLTPLEIELSINVDLLHERSTHPTPHSHLQLNRAAMNYLLDGVITKLPEVGDTYTCKNVINPNIHSSKKWDDKSYDVDWCIHDHSVVKAIQRGAGLYEIFMLLDALFARSSYAMDTYQTHNGKQCVKRILTGAK